MCFNKTLLQIWGMLCLTIPLATYSIDLSDDSKYGVLDAQKVNFNLYNSPPDQFDMFNSINPDQYYVGGGDVFYISIIGNSSIQYTGTVNQQCELFIPALGMIKLGKVSLADAKKEIAEYVQTKLKKTNNIYVELIKVKKVTFSINGAVANPGTYTLSGALRLLDAIRAGNNGVMASFNERNFREILCTTRDSVGIIDLFGYLFRNDIASNPYLYPGTNITISYATRHVMINAPIRPAIIGGVPIKEKEPLSDFLSLFKFDASADTSKVFLQRTQPDNQSTTRTIPWNEAASILLQDMDVITVSQKKNYSVLSMASVSGEVASPGLFPILRDSTTAKDLLELAGGVTAYGDMARAAIVRHSKIESSDSSKVLLLSKNQAMGIRPEINAGLSKMTLTGDYSIIELTASNYSTKLYPNDNVVVPRKDRFVYVSGNVKHPGAYEYNPGKRFSYYINLAGGYTNKADKINAFGIRSFNSVSQIIDLSEVRSADVIVVPDSQQAKFLTIILLPILQTAATIISVALALYTVAHSSGK
jgi:protein involved in polysaccharide export with SLBB domain